MAGVLSRFDPGTISEEATSRIEFIVIHHAIYETLKPRCDKKFGILVDKFCGGFLEAWKPNTRDVSRILWINHKLLWVCWISVCYTSTIFCYNIFQYRVKRTAVFWTPCRCKPEDPSKIPARKGVCWRISIVLLAHIGCTFRYALSLRMMSRVINSWIPRIWCTSSRIHAVNWKLLFVNTVWWNTHTNTQSLVNAFAMSITQVENPMTRTDFVKQTTGWSLRQQNRPPKNQQRQAYIILDRYDTKKTLVTASRQCRPANRTTLLVECMRPHEWKPDLPPGAASGLLPVQIELK